MAKRHLDEIDNYDYLASNSNLPEIVVTTPRKRNILQEWWDDISNYNFRKDIKDIFKDTPNARHMVVDLQNFGIIPEGSKDKNYSYGVMPANIDGKLPINREQIIDYLSTQLAKSNIVKRGLRTVMSTTMDHNPIPAVKSGIKSMLKNKDYNRLVGIGKYILTGKGNDTKAFRHFGKFANKEYTGTGSKNGYVDALLFGNTPDNMRYIGTGEKEAGVHLSTIKQRGYNPKDIRVFETNYPYDAKFDESTTKPFVGYISNDYIRLQQGELQIPYNEIKNNIIIKPGEGSFTLRGGKYPADYDAQGHLVEILKDDNNTAIIRGQDFTDFNWDAYSNKWLGRRNRKLPFIEELGLKTVDKATTPIIVRTPWGMTSDLSNFEKWHTFYDGNREFIFPNQNPTTNFYNFYKYGGHISLKNGGTIHINPENRGKFNATKERTGKTTEELTHSKNPLTRKRAIFAQNAAKWKK